MSLKYINGPASVVVVRPSVVRLPQCSSIFFSENAWPIEAKFYVAPPWVGGTKFCSQHLGHMTKMAATPETVAASDLNVGSSRHLIEF